MGNSRSSICLNSLKALEDLSKVLKSKLNKHVDLIMIQLFRKGADKGSIAYNEVKNVLREFCINCQEKYYLPVLIKMSLNKNKEYKLNVLFCFTALIEKKASSILKMKYFGSIMKVVFRFLTDKDEIVRE
jgi:hypothetical protein